MLVIQWFILFLESLSEVSASQIEISEDSDSYRESTEQSSEITDEINFIDHYDAHYCSLDLSKKTFESKINSFYCFRFSQYLKFFKT